VLSGVERGVGALPVEAFYRLVSLSDRMDTLSSRLMAWRWWIVGVVLTGVAVACLFRGFADSGASVALAGMLQLLMLSATIALSLSAIRTAPRVARPIWILVLIGFVLFLAVNAYGLLTDPDHLLRFAQRIAHPEQFGSLSDLVFALAYVPLVIAGLLLVRFTNADRDRASALDALILFVVGVLITSQFIIGPAWVNTGQDPSVLLPYLVNVTIDLAGVSFVARMWFSTTRNAQQWARYLAIAVLAIGLTDLVSLAAKVASNGTPSTGIALPGIGFIVAVAMVGAAALHPSHKVIATLDPLHTTDTRMRTLLTLGLATFTPLLIIVSDSTRTVDADRQLLVPISLVISVLIMVRIGLLLKAYHNVSVRNQIVQAAALENIPNREALNERLPKWVMALIDDIHAESMLVEPGDIWRATPSHVSTFATGDQPTDPNLAVATGYVLPRATRESLTVFARVVGALIERTDARAAFVSMSTERRISELLENSAEAIVIVDNSLGIHYATSALGQFTSTSPHQLTGTSLLSVVAEEDHDAARDLLLKSHVAGRDVRQLRVAAPSGTRLCEFIAVSQTGSSQTVLTIRDITEQRKLQDELARRALYDPLTGLANRDLFRDRLRHALVRHERHGAEFAVLMLDLDDFKEINDSLGHPAGDEMLKIVSERITDTLREGDTAARIGGDEFALVLEDVRTSCDVANVAERLLARINEPIVLEGRELFPAASIGVVASRPTMTVQEAERDADLALYQAKGRGKNQWALFENELHRAAVQRMALISELRTAIERGEIVPWYQPIVELQSGAIAGIEALARWEHPQRGIVSPAEFIAVAEDSGLIVELGMSMLRRSLFELAAMHAANPHLAQLRLTVNLSPRQMLDPALPAKVSAALAESGVKPGQLIFEITEGVLLPDGGVPLDRLEEIRDLGVDVYIDDFGTGWSSLGYLRTMPVAGLKLAREFIEGLPNPSQLGLVTAIHDLATNLALDEIIAEGIETESQRLTLLRLGYRFGQGYLLGRPVPPMELADLLTDMVFAQWSKSGDNNAIQLLPTSESLAIELD